MVKESSDQDLVKKIENRFRDKSRIPVRNQNFRSKKVSFVIGKRKKGSAEKRRSEKIRKGFSEEVSTHIIEELNKELTDKEFLDKENEEIQKYLNTPRFPSESQTFLTSFTIDSYPTLEEELGTLEESNLDEWIEVFGSIENVPLKYRLTRKRMATRPLTEEEKAERRREQKRESAKRSLHRRNFGEPAISPPPYDRFVEEEIVKNSANGGNEQMAITRDTLDNFPYHYEVVKLEEMFVDKDYQRPLTSFYKTVVEKFNPALVGTLILSLRSDKKYAIIDGQTRWKSMTELKRTVAPCLVYEGLTKSQEAELFELFQTQRRGVKSWDRFRAALVAGNPESQEIKRIVEEAGYVMGGQPGEHLTAVSALEKCYRRDIDSLERGLFLLKDAWPDVIPPGDIIRGVHQFLVQNPDVKDQRFIDRLRTVNVLDLKRRALALREGSGTTGPAAKYMAEAMKAQYQRGMTN